MNARLLFAGTPGAKLGQGALGLALVLGAFPGVAQTHSWVGGTSTNYFTAANWSPAGINFAAVNNATLNIGAGAPNHPVHAGGSAGTTFRPLKLNVLTGARFTVGGTLYPSSSDSLNGTITVNAPADFNIRSAAYIGHRALGLVTVNGGALSTRNGLAIAAGAGGRATVTVAGGALNVGGGGTNMDLELANGPGLTARLNITGGAVNIARDLLIGAGGSIFLSGIGQLSIAGDKRAQVAALVAAGQLTHPAGQTLDVGYDNVNTLVSIYRNPNSLYRETPTQVTLNNGVTGTGALVAVVDKATSNLVSLRLGGVETLNQLGTSRKGGYYDFTTSAGFETMSNCVFSVTKDSANVVDVSFKRRYSPATGQPTPCDADIHYVLNRADTGLYTYSVLEHLPAYPAFDLGSWRQVLWIAQNGTNYLCERIYTDSLRSWQMPSVTDFGSALATPIQDIVRLTTGVRAGKYDGKYEYSLPHYETTLYGHASDVNGIGSWIVQGSEEYFNGGPTYHELNAAAGILHVCMNGVHYNAKGMSVAPGEQWRKIYGPYLIYTSTGATGSANWAAARQRGQQERAKWPYRWLNHPAYPLAAARGRLTGRFVVQDPLKPAVTGRNAWIGVTQISNPDNQWQFEEKNYQYWVKTDAQGDFDLPNVRPGTYTLFAYTDGAVGEYRRPGVAVTAGGTNNLGTVTWSIPRTNGALLWEIGVPNRKANEFKFGDFDYAEGYVQDKFNTTFANPIEYSVTARNWATALPYAHSPYPTSATAQVPWKWRLNFTLPAVLPPTGTVTLTIAVAGSDRSNEFVYVNGEITPFTTFYPDNSGGNGFLRQTNFAKYGVKTIAIPVARLRPGPNTITLMMASSQAMANHVMYDYISLEGDVALTPLATTGAGLAPAPALVAYPVPAHGTLQVRGATPGTALVLRNALGQLVYTAPAAADGSATLALPATLPAGIYLLRNGARAVRVAVE